MPRRPCTRCASSSSDGVPDGDVAARGARAADPRTRRATGRASASSERHAESRRALAGQRDLRQPERVVEVDAAQAARAAARRAGPGRPRRAGSATPGTPATSGSATSPCASSRASSETTTSRAPRRATPSIASRITSSAGPRRRDRDHRPAAPDRRDRPVHQIGCGVRLEQQARQLADLQRDLERRAVVDAARDDRAAVDRPSDRARSRRPASARAALRAARACARARRAPRASRVAVAKSSAIAPSELTYVFVAATASSSPASSAQHRVGGPAERRVGVVRDRDRRPSLPARLGEHLDDVGRLARLRDADDERAVEPRRLLVERVERRRRERDRHAVRAAEQVLRIARGVGRAAA